MLAQYSTVSMTQNNGAMSGRALSSPPLIGSTFMQTKAKVQIIEVSDEMRCFGVSRIKTHPKKEKGLSL
jgi:hypothetical protein